jgi:hypothetical protein
MRITRDLKLAGSIDTVQSGLIHFYSAQISRDTFDQFFAELGDVVSYCTNIDAPADLIRVAPQLAFPALKKAAIKRGTWDAPDGVKNGLVAEIARLTQVAYTSADGRQILPLDAAVSRGILDEDDRAEILSQVVYFLALSLAAEKRLAQETLPMAAKYRGWVYTSLAFSAHLDSLRESTAPASTTKKASSVIA